MASSTSASMVSPSMSMTSIFSRMHCMAASVHSAALRRGEEDGLIIITATIQYCIISIITHMSAPTKPWVCLAMDSGSTSSASFMLRVWMRKISRRPFSSGTPMSICNQ